MNQKRMLHRLHVLANRVKLREVVGKPSWESRRIVDEHNLAYVLRVVNDDMRKQGKSVRYYFDEETMSLKCEL